MDIVEFWRILQSLIFINVAVGKSNAVRCCNWESEDGVIEQQKLGDVVKFLLSHTLNRAR